MDGTVAKEPEVGAEQVAVAIEGGGEMRGASLLFAFEEELEIDGRALMDGAQGVERG